MMFHEGRVSEVGAIHLGASINNSNVFSKIGRNKDTPNSGFASLLKGQRPTLLQRDSVTHLLHDQFFRGRGLAMLGSLGAKCSSPPRRIKRRAGIPQSPRVSRLATAGARGRRFPRLVEILSDRLRQPASRWGSACGAGLR